MLMIRRRLARPRLGNGLALDIHVSKQTHFLPT